MLQRNVIYRYHCPLNAVTTMTGLLRSTSDLGERKYLLN